MTQSTRYTPGRVTRLRVFRYVKREMEATGECPTSTDVAAALDMNASYAADHMRALRNADGLPFAIPEGAQRWGNAQRGQALDPERGAILAAHGRGRLDPRSPVPVDHLFRIAERRR